MQTDEINSMISVAAAILLGNCLHYVQPAFAPYKMARISVTIDLEKVSDVSATCV